MGDRPAGVRHLDGPQHPPLPERHPRKPTIGGLSHENAAHAFWLLDSYIYGQVIQETSLPFNTSEQMTETAGSTLELVSPTDFPHLVAMYEDALVTGYSVDIEFEFGLELILAGLEQLRPISCKSSTGVP